MACGDDLPPQGGSSDPSVDRRLEGGDRASGSSNHRRPVAVLLPMSGLIEVLGYGGGGGPSIATVALVIAAIFVLGLIGLALTGRRG
jgi:hypothetical protein